jgi:ornithine--oxo-acid transaminase
MNTISASTHASQYYFDLEERFCAHNYHPLPVVLKEGKGVHVWDVEGRQYYDFLSGYSAVNQGHCHPKILQTFLEQASKLTLTSRAFFTDALGEYTKFMCEKFGYDKLLPMNTGVEAVETAIKLCRHWAYRVKGIRQNEAVIIVCKENFHGRTSTVISFSSDPSAYQDFGPYMPGFVAVPFNDLSALEAALQNKNVAGFLVEPIQGEAGVVVPDNGFLSKAKQYCEDANVLFIADEIQTGLGRTGKMLCCDHENVRADILILGKALSGGMMPVSAVLADDEIMLTIKSGEHGSTYGGNPLASRIAITSIDVLEQEGMIANAEKMGSLLRSEIEAIETDLISVVRGKGLLNAIVIEHTNPDAAWEICLLMKEKGLLAKPTHGDKIRLAPPLIITDLQIQHAAKIIAESVAEFASRH